MTITSTTSINNAGIMAAKTGATTTIITGAVPRSRRPRPRHIHPLGGPVEAPYTAVEISKRPLVQNN
jgi:hypothetical protein